eukprot:6752694-Pyramimonas_sp.AAC.1
MATMATAVDDDDRYDEGDGGDETEGRRRALCSALSFAASQRLSSRGAPEKIILPSLLQTDTCAAMALE